ncbi:putative DNA-binding protein [Paenibacillus sp. J5C_2022]|nr:putative DNA-binding protein [Paenibacillus sp. J5C2022]MCU6707074.1 putative DNA-binding protein [Paenibacillus sp. J5C2022]
MQEPDALAKTTRMNLLLDFYDSLLTEKQRTILTYYYRDDFSLGEIALEFDISRQAVYDNIKRAEGALEGYESKLGLLIRHERLLRLTELLEERLDAIAMEESDKQSLKEAIAQFRNDEESAIGGGDRSWQHLKA